MTPLDRPLLDEITLAAAAVAVIALLLVVVVMIRVRRLRRSFQTVDTPDGRQTVLEALGRVQVETGALRRELAEACAALAATRSDVADALRHVAVVRYDAFGDMGGRMSFTAALLDDAGDGLVISSINGRTEGRSYAKGVKAGQSESPLSPEEEQAVALALRGAAPAGSGGSRAASVKAGSAAGSSAAGSSPGSAAGSAATPTTPAEG